MKLDPPVEALLHGTVYVEVDEIVEDQLGKLLRRASTDQWFDDRYLVAT